MQDTALLKVASPSGSFAAGEIVRGTSSGASDKLTTVAPFSGSVDITVENSFGQRGDGGSVIAGGFTYV